MLKFQSVIFTKSQIISDFVKFSVNPNIDLLSATIHITKHILNACHKLITKHRNNHIRYYLFLKINIKSECAACVFGILN